MFAEVIIDEVLSTDRTWTYIIPPDLISTAEPGHRVFVPFGHRKQIEGFIMSVHSKTKIPTDKLKPIAKIPDNFVAIKPEVLKVIPQICDQFKLRTIDVIRLFIPATLRTRKRTTSPKAATLKSLVIASKNITLTADQQSAVKEILSKPQTYILHGVTGSGKTEVYMHVIQKILDQGKTAIMLVPEIGLTPQMLGHFQVRFGETVAMIHSGLTPSQRLDQWLSLHRGDKKIVIGARSAVFAPLENIGVIIIDEEHDTSYFSESNPRYHTHEIAKLRASIDNCSLVLGSATPSIETMHSGHRILPLNCRINNLSMPKINIVDMLAEIRGGHGGIISRDLLVALRETIMRGKQAMLFLNRRGFSSYVGCLDCGWIARCEHCDISLVWHRDDAQLKCHYCSSRYSRATKCLDCSSNLLRYGQVGTQKLVDELETILPNTPIFRLDTDTSKETVDILSKFASTPGSILVGTQIIAKGHDFPSVEVVGIIDADNALHFADYRAAERTFALITQVSGRAGRSDTQGKVYLQTLRPKHYVYQLVANYDYKEFMTKELNTRQVTNFPPFTTIVRILVTGTDELEIKKHVQVLMKDLRLRESELVFLAAMKSPLGRLQNKFRYQILIRTSKTKAQGIINWAHDIIKSHPAKNLHTFLEINPQSLS